MSKSTLLLISLFILSSCKQVQHFASIESNGVRLDNSQSEQDPEILAMIEPYKTEVQVEMEEVIGELDTDLSKKKPSSSLGNWFADLLKEAAENTFQQEVDFAIQNYGGIRIPTVGKGPITKGKIFELMPFDNNLVLMELDAPTVRLLCDIIAASGGWPVSDGLSMEIQDTTAHNIKINDLDLEENKTYTVALPDYVANGGDECFFLTDLERDNSGVFLRTLVIELIENKTKESPILEVDTSARITKL